MKLSEFGNSRTLTSEQIEFADEVLRSFKSDVDKENDLLELYDALDVRLDATVEEIAAAHFESFIWCILSTIRFHDMDIGADDAAEAVTRSLLNALRLIFAKMYDAETVEDITSAFCLCGHCSCHDAHDVTDRELDADFDYLEEK